MSDLDDVLHDIPALVELLEVIQKVTRIGGDDAKQWLAVAHALAGLGLDGLRRTISVDEMRTQVQRLGSGDPQRSADAIGRAEIDELFGDGKKDG